MKETNTPKNAACNSDISALYEMMLEDNLEELEINSGDTKVYIRRKGAATVAVAAPQQVACAPAQAAPVAAPVAAAEQPSLGETVKSPIIGVFYRSSSPGAAPFSSEGDVVAPGKTLCIVEAMKVMNEIKADCRMKIVKILVENGKPITAGQDLFVIEKQ
jgi:acetyl-CoA carboxylase biotin carboxyl carrier protein